MGQATTYGWWEEICRMADHSGQTFACKTMILSEVKPKVKNLFMR